MIELQDAVIVSAVCTAIGVYGGGQGVAMIVQHF